MTEEQAQWLRDLAEGDLTLQDLLHKDPVLHDKFVCEGLIDKLMASFVGGEVGLRLDYWLLNTVGATRQPSDWLEHVSLPTSCGTTACIAGHTVLLQGAEFFIPRGQQVAQGCRFLQRNWTALRLAQLVWEATYPEGDQREFYKGITDALHVFENYAQGPSLNLGALQCFLHKAASWPAPPDELAP